MRMLHGGSKLNSSHFTIGSNSELFIRKETSSCSVALPVKVYCQTEHKTMNKHVLETRKQCCLNNASLMLTWRENAFDMLIVSTDSHGFKQWIFEANGETLHVIQQYSWVVFLRYEKWLIFQQLSSSTVKDFYSSLFVSAYLYYYTILTPVGQHGHTWGSRPLNWISFGLVFMGRGKMERINGIFIHFNV